MQVDTGADSTVISSLIWTELGKPQLNGKVRRLEAYDGHQLTLLGSLTCDVEWNGSKYRQQQLAVVQFDKKFGLLGRDILPQEGINAVSDERLPAVKGYKAHVKLIPGWQPMFCKARKIPLPLQDRVEEKLETMVRQGILEPVQPGGVTNASPVVWQRKKNGALRLCVDLKVHINGKVMDEDYPIPDMETNFHNLHGASYFGKIDLSDAYYQIELDKDAKEICTINTSQGLFKMCRLPQGLKSSSSIFQNCNESTLKGIKGVVIFQDDVLVYGRTKDQYEKRMLAVKNRLREKNFTINEKKSHSKPVSSVIFLGYSVSKEGIALDPKHVEKIRNAKPPSNMKQLESFVGLANFYGRMIQDFATKMLTLNEIRKEEFRWDKEEQNAFENIKNEFCANPLVQPYSLTKEATVTTDASEKAIGRVLTRRTSCDLRIEELVTSRTKLLQYWARGTCNRLCGHMIETIPTRKKVHSTDWPQTSRISLRPRRRNSENSISKNYKMGDSADGIWLRIEVYTRRTYPPRWCSEQTRLWWWRWQWSSLLCSWQYLLRPIRPGDPVRHQNWAGIKSTLSRCHQTNEKRHLETVLRCRERIWTTERRLDHSQWNHLSRSCAFQSTQAKTHGDGQSSWNSPRQKCNRNSSSNDGLVARHQSTCSSIC